MAVKLAKEKKKKENTGKAVVTDFLQYVSALWAIVLVSVIPLYMKEGYYQIGTAKYDAYAHIVVFGMPVLLLLAALYIVFSLKESGVSAEGVKRGIQGLSVTDCFVLGYMLVVLVSFFACGQMKEALWGYNGWYMGLISQITFVLIYFLFSRFLKDYPLVVVALCVFASYTFIAGILHRLLIDIVGTYENLTDYYKTQFLSTLGQASWYSSFMTTVLPIGIFAFWYFKNHLLRAVSGVFVFLGFMTMVTQNTDSAYFGFFAAMLVLFHVSVKSAERMRRLCETTLLFLFASKCMQGLLKIWPNDIMTWDTISAFFIFDNRIWILVMLCIAVAVLFLLLDKKEKYPQRAMKIVRNVLYAAVVLMLVAWVVILVAGIRGQLPAFADMLVQKIPYLAWNDRWGNGRGFTWKFTVQMFGEMNLKDKLIGVGPDCYALYAHGNYNEQLRAVWGDSILTNAHNEWLNMCVNTGIIGGCLYLGIFVSSLVRFVKKSEEIPVLLGFAACIAAYCAHNIFCYQEVLCTPFVFLFIALGEYQIRKKAK